MNAQHVEMSNYISKQHDVTERTASGTVTRVRRQISGSS